MCVCYFKNFALTLNQQGLANKGASHEFIALALEISVQPFWCLQLLACFRNYPIVQLSLYKRSMNHMVLSASSILMLLSEGFLNPKRFWYRLPHRIGDKDFWTDQLRSNIVLSLISYSFHALFLMWFCSWCVLFVCPQIHTKSTRTQTHTRTHTPSWSLSSHLGRWAAYHSAPAELLLLFLSLFLMPMLAPECVTGGENGIER